MSHEFVIEGKPRSMRRSITAKGFRSTGGKIGRYRWQPDEEAPKPGVRIYVERDVKLYQEHVGWTAKSFGVRPQEGPLDLHIELRLCVETPLTVEGDADNYVKSIQDALKRIAYEDDAQIVNLHVKKRFVRSEQRQCAIVRVEPCMDDIWVEEE